jgi:LacI family transcriptional regulator
MMSRPTVHDIAREAGVSLATVDRVLNGRPKVRESSIKLVMDAVEKLGYVRDISAANLARRKQYRFAFVLPDDSGQFLETVYMAFADASQMVVSERLSLEVVQVRIGDPNATARVLTGLLTQGFDGVAIMCPETPQVRDAVMRLKQAGVAVVAMISDLPSSPRDRFVGVDNVAAGRTAGALMGRFLGGKAGKVLVISESLASRDNMERRYGFDSIISECFPNIEVLPTIESRQDDARLSSIMRSVLLQHQDIWGVYSLGSENLAVIDVLRAAPAVRGAAVIMHELTPVTRAALEAHEIDVVIMQNVGHIVRSSIRVLRAHVDQSVIVESQEQIRIEIVTKENLLPE